ncbi:Alpha/beta hydrolase family protein [Stieleria maiorica]|uniref:Alpha/beta hydrolase family protein n=1 Tax=Stieleria maiorica TaxID=2795974 RepID=A0A5B9MPB5_9BACT|nr:alpha/beta fold hydrolase [Stieleria maiorica]QEG01807.1 Alpha/beta hydrolase family protein [Stieleria maiorica]
MNEHESTSYRVRFPSGADRADHLAGIIDRPKMWHPWKDAGGTRPRPVVVYSHCFTCNKDFKATVKISRALARYGIAVLRYDMTGLGGSDGDFSQTNFTTNLRDLAAAIRFANDELGPVTALVGHSFGGIASLVTAAKAADDEGAARENVDLLRELKFVATLAAPSDTQHLATLLSRMNPAIESEGQGDVTIGGITWTIRRQMLEDFRRHNVTSLLPQIDRPVLLLHSPVDETVGIDHAIRLMTLIQTDRSTDDQGLTPVSLMALPGADHLLAKHPQDLTFVARILAAWCHRFLDDDHTSG